MKAETGKKLKVLQTRYGGLTYRSRTEARWAVFFDMIGLRHQYEPEGYEIRVGYYRPDFWLPDLRMFFEVKGTDPTHDEVEKCQALCEAAECDMLMSSGAPEERFSLMWFDRGGQREGLYVIALDRNPKAGFWLLNEYDPDVNVAYVGPGNDNQPRSGPMFSGALEAAYAEARSCRFQGDERRRPFQPLPGSYRGPANDQSAKDAA